jgi:putative oxidoreductase
MGQVTKIERAAIASASLPAGGADCQAYEPCRGRSHATRALGFATRSVRGPRAPGGIPGLTTRADSGAIARDHAPPPSRCLATRTAVPVSAYAGLALRTVVGAVYLFQAYLALFAATPKGLAAYIEKLGFHVHTILAVGVIAITGIGGAMLVIGLWTRLAASLNAAVLLLGLLTVYVRQGVLLKGTVVDAAIGRTWAGYEYVALLAAATVLLAAGGGAGGKK